MTSIIPIRIAIAQSRTILRETLAFTISQLKSFHIGISVSNGKELIISVGNTFVLPDICIIDINMPLMNGYETLPIVKQRWPQIKVLVFSIYENEYAIKRMLLLGANGYISSNATIEEIVYALHSMNTLGYYYSEKTPIELFNEATTGTINVPAIADREKDILQLLCKNYSYKEIGKELFLSPRTVDAHRDRLFSKLNIKSKEGLILFALQSGIVTL